MEAKNKPFAEIVESNCTNFLAQTWNSSIKPDLGTLVETKTNSIKIFGIVNNIQTGSQDPMRYPFTYQKTEEELKNEQPQIFEFLKTTFEVQTVGYQKIISTKSNLNNVINYNLPPIPANIHSFVKHTDMQTIKIFFSKTDFLPLLFSTQITNLDEILISIIRNNKNTLNKNFLERFVYHFSLLSNNDYKRLKLFLKRVQQIFLI